jgi:hypothetical protein
MVFEKHSVIESTSIDNNITVKRIISIYARFLKMNPNSNYHRVCKIVNINVKYKKKIFKIYVKFQSIYVHVHIH